MAQQVQRLQPQFQVQAQTQTQTQQYRETQSQELQWHIHVAKIFEMMLDPELQFTQAQLSRFKTMIKEDQARQPLRNARRRDRQQARHAV